MIDELAPIADEYVPFGHGVGVAVLVELQYMPAGHSVNDFKPSTPQNASAGQSKQLLLLTPPVVGRYVPAAHDVGLVVAGLGQYAPAEQYRQSPSARAAVAGMKVPAGQGCGAADEAGQKNPAGHA